MKKFLIETQHTVHIEDYEHGEQDYVNWYKDFEIIEAEDLEGAVNEYLRKKQLNNISWGDFETNEINPKNAGARVFVNKDNVIPSPFEWEAWKNGKNTLYANNIILKASEIIEIKFN